VSIPLPWVVGVAPYVAGAEDLHGNPADTWGTPVATAAFWWTPTATEPAIAGHDRLIVSRVLVVDSATPIGPRDRVTMPGGVFEVDGHAEDYDHGPFSYSPNRKPINLKRVEG
jgi:hypothetical protein